MIRAIELIPLELTRFKSEKLDWLLEEALSVANCISFVNGDLSKKELITLIRKSSRLQYQVINALVRKNNNHKQKAISVPFNIPRSAKFFFSDAGTPCFRVTISVENRRGEHLIIPIKKNRCWQRFESLTGDSWTFTAFGITPRKTVVVYLKKEKEIKPRKNIIGVDINSKCFAVTVLKNNGKVLKQIYLGKDIWVKRKKIMERKALLQSHTNKGSIKARKKLRKLRRKESNFVKNRVGEIVRDIVKLADKYNAEISIENLKRFKPIARRVNREILSIPFLKFRQTLESRCFDHNIPLNVVDAYHTSKWCPNCGAVLKSGHHGSNYSLFKCKCGLEVNSDRKASLAIALKSLLGRKSQLTIGFLQFPSRRVSVNGLFRSDESVGINAVHDISTPMESL